MEISSAAIAFTGLIIGWSLHIAAFVWWLSRQFSDTRNIIYERAKEITTMLRDHEREDMVRFGKIERDLAALNADDGRRLNGR